MTDVGEAPDCEALWRFSLTLYALPGVAQALLVLQDHHGLDVNLMLLALWLGISGRGRLGGDLLAAADRAGGSIRAEIVEPLRALRRRLKEVPDADVQRLRAGVMALELAAEELVQTRLAGLAAPCSGEIPEASRLTTAYANLAAYLGPERAGGAEAALIREALGRYATARPLD